MKELATLIETLTETERRELYTALAFEFRSGGGNDKFSDDEQLVSHAIDRAVGGQRLLEPVLAGAKIPRAEFRETVAFLMSWLDRGCGRPVSRSQRIALLTTGVELLTRYLRTARSPVLHRTLVQQLDKIPSLLDQAFPGYHQARVLDRIAAIAVAA